MQRLVEAFRSKKYFLLRLVTIDETSVHYYEPENKAQSRQRVEPGTRGQEAQETTIRLQGDGHSILGRSRRYYVGLFTQEKYINWSIKCKLARPAENRHL